MVRLEIRHEVELENLARLYAGDVPARGRTEAPDRMKLDAVRRVALPATDTEARARKPHHLAASPHSAFPGRRRRRSNLSALLVAGGARRSAGCSRLRASTSGCRVTLR